MNDIKIQCIMLTARVIENSTKNELILYIVYAIKKQALSIAALVA